MSKIPNNPFRIIVYYRNGDKQDIRAFNRPTLREAYKLFQDQMTKSNVTRVETLVIIDESSKGVNIDG